MADGQNSHPNVQEGQAAETVNVSTETDSSEELIGGKFKSVDDLLTSYKELERKLGGEGQTTGDDTSDNGTDTDAQDGTDGEGAGSEETPDDTNDDDETPYGEAVANALKSAGVDPGEAAEEFEKNEGILKDETYEKFEKAGFPRAVVDAYLNGVSSQRDTATSMTAAQIAQVKAVAGGDDGFSKVRDFIKGSWEDADIEAYNEAVSSGDVTKATEAVSGAYRAYLESFGSEGRMVGGRRPGANVSGFASEADYLEAMADKRYKTSAAYRSEVSQKLANSSNIMKTR
jgi:hypothetical protein